MPDIDKIRIHNFKAFYTGLEPEEIILDGRNLLMYGENGSGKSSIYWALYTLFQSETKTPDEIKKYFSPTHEEQLINFSYLNQRPDFTTDADGKITNPVDIGKNAEVEVILKDGNNLKIDKDGFYESIPNKLQDLHRHSDFITHRLLVNFYNFRNSREINLWEVFVRDFFPFLIESKGRGSETLWQKLKNIEENLPFLLNNTAKTFKRSGSKKLKNDLNLKIRKFNEDIDYWISRINTIANIVYRDELKNDDGIEISLKYREKLQYEHYATNRYTKDNITYTQATGYAKLNNPSITLNIKRINTDGSSSIIHRPQAYLNEARITQIALAVRFSLLHDTIKPIYEGQFLALDDLLISLDMSNRDNVLDAILNIYSKKYKIYLFTHERSFFNLVKRRLTNENVLESWEINEVFMNDFIDPQTPKIVSNEDYISKALFHLKNFDLPASANYLRKECELRMKYLLPENLAKASKENEETKYKLLENMLSSFIKYFSETLHQDTSKFLLLKEKKDIFLNPLSHDNLDSEIYKGELLQLHNLLLELRLLKKVVVLKCDDEFYIEQIDSAGSIRNYKVRVNENLLYYRALDNSIIHKNIKCEFLSYEIGGTSTMLNHPVNYKDLQKLAYKHAMQMDSINPYPHHLDEFKNNDSKIFRVILNEARI